MPDRAVLSTPLPTIAALLALLSAVGWLIAGGLGVLVAAAGAGVAMLLAPRLPAAAIMRMLRARPVSLDPWRGDGWHQVSEFLHALAARAGMTRVPKLYWQSASGPRAFSAGDAADPAIAISRGTLHQLPPRELQAVLAHEVAHLAAGDTRWLLLAETLARVTQSVALIGLLSAFVGALLTGEAPFSGRAMLGLAAAPFVARLLLLALARNREFAADAGAVRLTRDPEALASALTTIERLSRRHWGQTYEAALRNVPPVLRTHPPTEERIARLSRTEPA
ncbi:MAG: M48 family metalloprotease [Alphaproteobacteria bacterium]